MLEHAHTGSCDCDLQVRWTHGAPRHLYNRFQEGQRDMRKALVRGLAVQLWAVRRWLCQALPAAKQKLVAGRVGATSSAS